MSAPDPQLLGLSTLLQLEREARHAHSEQRLQFLLVNDPHRLIRYHQAILWRQAPDGAIQIAAISGLASFEEDAPFVQWLGRLLRTQARDTAASPRALAETDLPENLREGWRQYSPGHALLAPLLAPDGRHLGGLWLTRETPFQEAEIGLLGLLLDAYAHAWAALLPRALPWHRRLAGLLHRRGAQLGALLLLLLAGLLPVRQSVLAPAVVAPLEPLVVAAPYDGVISHFHVQPDRPVERGQLLFSLDDTVLRNRLEIARQELNVAEAEYLKAARKAFQDSDTKGEIALLKARQEQKAAEVEYVAQLLERIRVRAERAGIAIFGDPNDWLGKPVVVGEKVLQLADPQQVSLEIRLPVADAINLSPGAEVRLFLNVDPTHPRTLALHRAAYEAEVTPEGILAFRLDARFDDGEPPPRIGLKGTAKLYGEEVRLFYYLLRRPIAAARQWLGW